ncbi:hypothetical protein DMP17_22230 [Pseudonocardia sp. TMWB2A]|uniref:hypothetical protein n=1 Tax=Pseudonocardia sp. TMWB2A TaxID=687430 RepID=UPI00307F52FE
MSTPPEAADTVTDEQPRPLMLDTQDVIDELLKMPAARPFWELAQERATTRALGQHAQQQAQHAVTQQQEIDRLRNELARRDRDDRTAEAPAETAATEPGPATEPEPTGGVTHREL